MQKSLGHWKGLHREVMQCPLLGVFLDKNLKKKLVDAFLCSVLVQKVVLEIF